MNSSILRQLALLLLALALFGAACASSDEGVEVPAPGVASTSGPEELGPDDSNPDDSNPDESGSLDADTTNASGADTADETGDRVGCEPFPSFSEGSFYVESPERSELTKDLPVEGGVPLLLRLTVLDADGCAPLGDLPVEVWSAGPDGRYSGVSTQPDGVGEAAVDERWLRGRQQTNADGTVDFVTVVPGWIPGHAPHVHLTIPIDATRTFTARLVLPDAVTSEVYGEGVYIARGSAGVTAAMEIERDAGVDRSVIELSPHEDGYQAVVVVAVSEAELRGRPRSAMQSTEAPQDDAAESGVEGPIRTFDQIGGELQAMFNRAGSDLGLDPETLYAEFRFVTSDNPPDLRAIAERLGVTEDALALALPLLAGGAPTPGTPQGG